MQLLPGWTAIGVVPWQIHKVLLTEAPLRFGARRLRLGQSHRDTGLVAGEDLCAAEVAAIEREKDIAAMAARRSTWHYRGREGYTLSHC